MGPRIERSSSASPPGEKAAKSSRCSLEKSFRRGFAPVTASLTAGAFSVFFIDPEQT